MRTQKRTDAPVSSQRFLHFAPALLLVVVAASSHAGSNAVRDADGSRISVTAVAGDVDFTMAGAAVAVAPNATVLLPARIVTGHDGTVGLTQAGTNVSVASDTDVEIPAEAVDGNLIARLVQRRGNVFYDVAPRDLGKLRVETPLLVAVIKGTQFNVAVQPDSTTISLFEGRLEIRTPDDSDVVQLNAGEIAIRSLVDNEIRVVGMDDQRVAAPRARAAVAAAARAAPSDPTVAGDALAGDALVARIDTRDTSVVTKPAIAGVESATRAPVTTVVSVDSGVLDAALDTHV
ncbi:MAG TPA: FecR domain-containing protein, partial [Gammaproteobacteria bacterium]